MCQRWPTIYQTNKIQACKALQSDAVDLIAQLGVNADTFLMAIVVGASSALLTPIAHQNNTLILEPGGFHFSDFWRPG